MLKKKKKNLKVKREYGQISLVSAYSFCKDAVFEQVRQTMSCDCFSQHGQYLLSHGLNVDVIAFAVSWQEFVTRFNISSSVLFLTFRGRKGLHFWIGIRGRLVFWTWLYCWTVESKVHYTMDVVITVCEDPDHADLASIPGCIRAPELLVFFFC